MCLAKNMQSIPNPELRSRMLLRWDIISALYCAVIWDELCSRWSFRGYKTLWLRRKGNLFLAILSPIICLIDLEYSLLFLDSNSLSILESICFSTYSHSFVVSPTISRCWG